MFVCREAHRREFFKGVDSFSSHPLKKQETASKEAQKVVEIFFLRTTGSNVVKSEWK